jgi:allantoinase
MMRLFAQQNFNLTVYGVGRALELNPDVARAFATAGHEVASHAWRWFDYHRDGARPRKIERHRALRGDDRAPDRDARRSAGTPGGSARCTRRLVARHGGFLYDSDSYDDDLPHYVDVEGKKVLVIPYTLDNNDMKFAVPPGFGDPDGFERHLRDAFDLLLEEGRAGSPKMMSVGLHCRLVGRPGRARALQRFLAHVAKHRDEVWVARRADIARHWWAAHPPT